MNHQVPKVRPRHLAISAAVLGVLEAWQLALWLTDDAVAVAAVVTGSHTEPSRTGTLSSRYGSYRGAPLAVESHTTGRRYADFEYRAGDAAQRGSIESEDRYVGDSFTVYVEAAQPGRWTKMPSRAHRDLAATLLVGAGLLALTAAWRRRSEQRTG